MKSKLEKVLQGIWLLYVALGGIAAAACVIFLVFYVIALMNRGFDSEPQIFRSIILPIIELTTVVLAYLFGLLYGERFRGWPKALVPLVLNLVALLVLTIELALSIGSDLVIGYLVCLQLMLISMIAIVIIEHSRSQEKEHRAKPSV